MKIAVIGTGYVGLPTGVGFADLGFQVTCIDKLESKINDLNNGKITLFEAGLEELFQKNLKTDKLTFTTNMQEGVKDADVIIIAVGTPPHPETQEADMCYVYAAIEEVSKYLNKYTVIAVKSTVPVGTGDEIDRLLKKKNLAVDTDIVSLPEFLREGYAVEDFFNPDRVIVGTNSERAKKVINNLYKDFKAEILFVSRRSAETIKYASNSFLAMKVHYINEMANFCEKSGANIDEVSKGMGLDSRIGPKFLQPGPGYGGSCFPKDTLAMSQMAKKYGIKLHLVDITIEQNNLRKREMAFRIIDALKGVKEPKVAALGLTFKSGTDDVRESPAVEIVKILVENGIKVKAYDPKGMENAKIILRDSVYYANSVEDALKNADAIAVLTEWKEFKDYDYSKYNCLKFDFRNIINEKIFMKVGK